MGVPRADGRDERGDPVFQDQQWRPKTRSRYVEVGGLERDVSIEKAREILKRIVVLEESLKQNRIYHPDPIRYWYWWIPGSFVVGIWSGKKEWARGLKRNVTYTSHMKSSIWRYGPSFFFKNLIPVACVQSMRGKRDHWNFIIGITLVSLIPVIREYKSSPFLIIGYALVVPVGIYMMYRSYTNFMTKYYPAYLEEQEELNKEMQYLTEQLGTHDQGLILTERAKILHEESLQKKEYLNRATPTLGSAREYREVQEKVRKSEIERRKHLNIE